MLTVNCQNFSGEKVATSVVEIKFWYGTEQSFGNLGNSQRQINILGNIATNINDLTAYYILNGHQEKHYLTIGSDLHRLAEDGDFNIDIDRQVLQVGKNIVDLFVADKYRVLGSQKVIINYCGNKIWPLPYYIRWDDIKNIQDAVEIVDGEWEITDSGIRTRNKYYDRILAFGDSTWRNYEIETTVVLHGYNTPEEGAPTYNVAHVAIASRWPGHDADSLQPDRKWFPLGATSEFRITSDYDSCRWRIFDGTELYEEQSVDKYRRIEQDVEYRLKHRVEDFLDGRTLYSVKIWRADDQEPSDWDFQAVEQSSDIKTGSACLIAHHTDVTFGNIFVKPIIIK